MLLHIFQAYGDNNSKRLPILDNIVTMFKPRAISVKLIFADTSSNIRHWIDLETIQKIQRMRK